MDNIEKFNKEMDEKFAKFDKEIEGARLVSRDSLYKLTLLSASIIAFSVTLTSANILQLSVDIGSLKISWILFFLSIVSTYLSFFLESRIKFCKIWRSFQVSEFDKKDYTILDHLKVVFVALYSVILSPKNLFFCIWQRTDQKYRNYVANMNGKTIGLLADMEKIYLSFELLGIGFFITGIWFFVKSFM